MPAFSRHFYKEDIMTQHYSVFNQTPNDATQEAMFLGQPGGGR